MSKPSLYIRLVKRARSFMRGKMLKKIPFTQRLLKPLTRREYWLPTPHRIAMGVAIGVFYAFATLVLPVQMLFSALTCIYFRGNLPIALGTCWISNPFTVGPLAIAMVWVGDIFDRHFYDMPKFGIGIYGLDYEVDLYKFVVGCVFSGTVLALLVYPITFFILKWMESRRDKRRVC